MVKCGVIADLLILYVSGAGSEDSRALVDEHIKSCEECRAKLAEMRNSVVTRLYENDKAKFNVLKTFKKKIFRRNIIVAVIASCASIAAVIGAGAYVFLHETVVAYEKGLIEVKKSDGNVGETSNGELLVIVDKRIYDDKGEVIINITRKELLDIISSDKIFCRYSTNRIVKRGNETVNVVYVYFSETIASKMSKSTNKYSTRIVEPTAPKVDRTEVYYLDWSAYEWSTIKDDESFDNERNYGTLVWSGSLE
ncbi:MAG: zf-HC2 domain-containing protein [Clostridiales bacterium]|jgi:hypothetical protein|nr:zf-HC2 domain-containing protein [Clostridiales bacterium]